MAVSPFDDPLLSGLLGDEEIAPQFSPESDFGELNAFEAALARAEGAEGLIPEAAAEAIGLACAAFEPDAGLLRHAAARDGVIVPEYVRQLRARIGEPHGKHVHFGATSQDVIDTALVRRLRTVTAILDRRLAEIVSTLDDVATRFGSAPLMGRTRMQDALPITVGDRIGAWREPLARDRTRLAEIKPRLLVLQFGGAAGTRDKLGGKGEAVARRVADALGLAAAPPWHSQRDAVAEFAAWLALVSGSLGKLGADMALMGQNAIGEIEFGDTGGSSAMPHKANPVRAEVLVALGRYNGVLAGAMMQALAHEQERSGAAWTLEWLALPQMIVATGAGLRTALALLASVRRMGAKD